MKSLLALVFLLFISTAPYAGAADDGSIGGTVVDPLGGRVPSAAVRLVRDGQRIGESTTTPDGTFVFRGLADGRYQIEASASGFDTRLTSPVFVGAGARVTLEVRLSIGPLEQQVFVTAAATGVPASQAGAPATVLDAAALAALGNTDVLDPIRTVPGVQVVQSGGRGGTTSLFIRGGSANFNKILLDGVPANDVGGAFDFADLATTGVDRVEVLRGSNSVMYGSDAMTGVVSIETRRGQSRVPEARVSVDGGNLGTAHADVSLGGALRRVDYFVDYGHLRTDNSVPNNAYRSSTFAGRAGATVGSRTHVSATLRYIDTTSGNPNAISYFGIADDSELAKTATFVSMLAESQLTDRWQSSIRFGSAGQDYHYVNPTPTGQAYDPFGFGANYLGNKVTIVGANGYSVTGRAILDYGGTYPSVFDSSTSRRLLSGDTTYQLTPALGLTGGVRVEDEHGDADTGSVSTTDRLNYGAFTEVRAAAAGRVFITGGFGVDHNAIFGNAATPRLSVAAYLRTPSATTSATTSLGDTKLTFNAGKGIKAPSLFQELSSLFSLLPPSSTASAGVSPIGPERSRGIDVGVEQGLARGRGRIRVAYFNNEFSNLIEFVSKSVLPQVGVSVAAASATAFGAYVNSQSNRARGVEMSGEAAVGPVKVAAAYMYLDAIVTASLSGGALNPSTNPAFPGVKIGAFSPLVGARPFRRPINSGSLTAAYTKNRAHVSLAGYFFGKQDDSTYLSDQDFGDSLLLPNKDLDAAYQRFDLNGSYRVHPRLSWYLTIENAFDAKFEAAAGFPSLPRTLRTGVTVMFGGDRRP